MKIALSGEIGSFSEEAAMLYLNRNCLEADMLYATDMEGVLKAVNENKAEIGIFPVVNSRGGLVKPAFKAMGNYKFNYFDEVWLEVQQCLMKKPNSDINKITQIVSHSQALAQCGRYLDSNYPKAKRIEWQDTALAAKDLSENSLPENSLVIAPARAGKIYGLEIIETGIQDTRLNLTTFIVIKKT